MRVRHVMAAAAAGVLLASVIAVPAGAAAVTYKVMTWNVAGWTLHDGSATNGLAQAVANAVRNADADFFALNELCFDQLHAVQDQLRANGWPQDPANFSRFEPTNDGGDGSCNGEQGGIAIFSRTPFGNASRFALPEDGRVERRKLICAPPANRPQVKFCTTHITHLSTGGINGVQLQYVLDRVEEFEAAGFTVIIAGDFNAQPDYPRMDRWYSPTLNHANNSGNRGRYRELDDTDTRCPGYGETTSPPGNTEGPCGLGKKLDLIFVRDNRYTGAYDADSVAIPNSCGGPCSDHRLVRGTVTVTTS
jgi:endonuclease/exonuclease/phosphatase family metal-dependent hydrolase